MFPGDISSVFLSGRGIEDYNPMSDMTPGAPGYQRSRQVTPDYIRGVPYGGMFQEPGINNYRQNLFQRSSQNQRYQEPTYGIPRMPPGMPDPFYPPRQPAPRFPSPGRKGQRNAPQPTGYYPQPRSSPIYPSFGFNSPGRKGSPMGMPSYQQPMMPRGYGQTSNLTQFNPYRFSGSSVPSNFQMFQNPHYQPYNSSMFNSGARMTNAPSSASAPAPNASMQPTPPPMTSPNELSDISQNILRMSTGLIDEDMQYDLNNDGRISSRDALLYTRNPGDYSFSNDADTMYTSAPTTAMSAPPSLSNQYNQTGFGESFNSPGRKGNTMPSLNQSQPLMGFGGGFNSSSNYPSQGKGMMGGGQTAFPNKNVLSSYINQ